MKHIHLLYSSINNSFESALLLSISIIIRVASSFYVYNSVIKFSNPLPNPPKVCVSNGNLENVSNGKLELVSFTTHLGLKHTSSNEGSPKPTVTDQSFY
jgi:hypothetical protein